MTKTMIWLNAKAPGLKNLSKEEQGAIMDFPLLWSLFEARILDERGCAKAICDVVETWHKEGTLDPEIFNEALARFRDRYFVDGEFTYHFDHLHLGKSDREEMVRGVIEGSDHDPTNCAAAALIIVYRYRNNLFHGVKWQYELKGQVGNFTAANNVLMKVLERHGALAD